LEVVQDGYSFILLSTPWEGEIPTERQVKEGGGEHVVETH